MRLDFGKNFCYTTIMKLVIFLLLCFIAFPVFGDENIWEYEEIYSLGVQKYFDEQGRKERIIGWKLNDKNYFGHTRKYKLAFIRQMDENDRFILSKEGFTWEHKLGYAVK